MNDPKCKVIIAHLYEPLFNATYDNNIDHPI